MGKHTKGPELGNTGATGEAAATGPELRHELIRWKTAGDFNGECRCQAWATYLRRTSQEVTADYKAHVKEAASHAGSSQPEPKPGPEHATSVTRDRIAIGCWMAECSCGWNAGGFRSEPSATGYALHHKLTQDSSPAGSPPPPLSPLERELLEALKWVLPEQSDCEKCRRAGTCIGHSAIARAEGRS